MPFESVHCTISDKIYIPRRFNGWREGEIRTHCHTQMFRAHPSLSILWKLLSYQHGRAPRTYRVRPEMHLKSVSILIHPTVKTRTVIQKGFHVGIIFVCFHCLPEHLKEVRFLLSNIYYELSSINQVISLDVLLFAPLLIIQLSIGIYHFEVVICGDINY
jgi:hypothetical protein